MRQITLKLKNSKKETFNASHFYKLYIKEKRGLFYPYDIDLNLKKKSRIKKEILTRKTFRKIIATYLMIYFKDLFFQSRDSYFFLGGKLTLAVVPKRIRVLTKHMNSNSFNDNLNLVWYRRPSKRFKYIIDLKKIMGSGSKIKKYENEARENNMLDLFPNFKELMRKIKQSNQLIICIQK